MSMANVTNTNVSSVVDASAAAVVNANGKRTGEAFDDDIAMRDNDTEAVSVDGEDGAAAGGGGGENGGRPARKKGGFRFKRMKTFKPKAPKVAVYRENVSPIQILNEVHPNLEYAFEEHVVPPAEGVVTAPLKKKFVCHVTVRVVPPPPPVATPLPVPAVADGQELPPEQQQQEQQPPAEPQPEQVYEFVGEGSSKKDAKKVTAHRALLGLFAASYTPPQEVLDSIQSIVVEANTPRPPPPTKQHPAKTAAAASDGAGQLIQQQVAPVVDEIAAMRGRLLKLCAKSNVATKSATQLLHECCKQISETATCVQESGATDDQRFAFKITNALDPEAATNEAKCVAYGFGKSKKDAKNAAAKQALRQFFDFDVDQIMASVAAYKVSGVANGNGVKENQPPASMNI